MTAAPDQGLGMAAAPAPARAAAAPVIVARDLLAAEWIKLRSVRSNYWTALAAVLVTIGSAAVVARSFAAGPAGRASATPFGPLTESFLGYAEYAVLPFGILGVLAFTSEYSTGLIRVTLTAAPQRTAVLAAKAAVAGLVALVAGELLALGSFLLTQAVLGGSHHGLPLSAPGVPGAVAAAGCVLAVSVLTGLALGAIIRHVAGAIAALVGVLYLLGFLCLLLPPPWHDRIGRLTPAFAAAQVVAQHPHAGLLSPAWSMVVLLAWPAAALVAATIVISHRDA
jgi:ABC-type transport system involved in multi-copper enzyme maturation permease subunit